MSKLLSIWLARSNSGWQLLTSFIGLCQRTAIREGSIYRIWSTDWFCDPKGELQHLDAQIKELVRSKADTFHIIRSNVLNVDHIWFSAFLQRSQSGLIQCIGETTCRPKPKRIQDNDSRWHPVPVTPRLRQSQCLTSFLR